MERLTIDEIIEHCDRKTRMYEKACDIKYLETTTMNNPIKEYWEHKQVAKYLRKLKYYEDLEEQGRLLKPPCKVGDTIYAVGEIVKEYKVISVGYPSNKATNRSEFCIETLPVNGSRVVVAFYDKEFGKNVFLAKSEAEVKLKELRGGE
jgi:hypothetical protein